MIPCVSKMIKRDQEGFTLIEVLVAVAITGLIVTGISAAIFHVMSINAVTANKITAVKQVENALHYIIRDGQMAQTIQPGGGGTGFPLSLSWVEWDSTRHDVSYTLDAGKLYRNHSTNGGALTSSPLADHINPEPELTSCQYAGGVLTFKLTASVSGFRPASETRTIEVKPRTVHSGGQ